mmetsp:Transcript_9199/g.8133  ORF Transcript_9199/g.8133 Transcript_9199/m.8133 type:complete len:90 (+) Transcript_9199:1844-2113(+)
MLDGGSKSQTKHKQYFFKIRPETKIRQNMRKIGDKVKEAFINLTMNKPIKEEISNLAEETALNSGSFLKQPSGLQSGYLNYRFSTSHPL